MDKFYYSVYGPLIEKFIDLKKSLGYKYQGGSLVLVRFDRLAVLRDEPEVGITKELAQTWGTKDPNETDSTWYIRIEIVKQFSLFLCHLGYTSYIARLPKFNCSYVPYIFSEQQICALFSACDKLQLNICSSRSIVFIVPALFRLLYSTGVRISEALSLLYDDVHLQERYLILRSCKNGRDRLIPISDSLAEVLMDYLKYRDYYNGLKGNGSGHLFISREGRPCAIQTAYVWFRKILRKAGIPHGGKGLGPRLHDLRHTFSVHTLSKMATGGLDLYYSLPILSAYLGHKSISATEKYVRLTADMYPSIIENSNKLCPYLYPELLTPCDHETN
ncbi:tyrosine-type recombinase/integrase [Pedobacter sp.]|jgi:integrase/recombinase XerD|uniref:tyrosine-type recombinase/integrase n=1 Tax=Pedobacter sp. TaxID=1411316 RepID=UPI002BEC29EE|nr:tyrosine-type recombinase/integrase [Pedobacter sp.]HWW42443.1 tyrosine-type recombinase/integrase [Pedobacter sp.]